MLRRIPGFKEEEAQRKLGATWAFGTEHEPQVIQTDRQNGQCHGQKELGVRSTAKGSASFESLVHGGISDSHWGNRNMPQSFDHGL